jgi:hypothetical protein
MQVRIADETADMGIKEQMLISVVYSPTKSFVLSRQKFGVDSYFLCRCVQMFACVRVCHRESESFARQQSITLGAP